jgi:type II secretory pathway pseudopilin PulG
MALEMQDLMALKSMGNENGMTPYEQVKLDYMSSKKPSNVAIAGLTVGVVGVVAGATAWIFGGMQASAKAGQAKEAAQSAKELAATQYTAALNLMNQQTANTNATLDRVIRGLERETDARVAGDINLTNTVTDSQTGSQASQLTAAQRA